MPQIKVNEIDQSVVTRVVSDDKVKVLCPIISSFGPAFDGTQDSVKTFTDLSAFRRAYGYTYAEFNPFENDQSYIYARELIKRGAAVSVIRLNNLGQTADFNIGPANRTTPSSDTICKASYHAADIPTIVASAAGSNPLITNGTDTVKIKLGGADMNKPVNIIPGTVSIENVSAKTQEAATASIGTITDDGDHNIWFKSETDSGVIGTIDYKTGAISATDSATINPVYTEDPNPITNGTYSAVGEDAYKYTFCPQIKSITAKYPGSFGNNIMISIAQVNTSRLAESYQYAVISVYFVDQEVNYSEDGTVTRIVNSTTLLENKRISTNPNDANYFEDVEFEFIKITAIESARSELAIVWSNIEAAPQSEQRYSGFPVIPFRYKADAFSTVYNFDAMFGQTTYGTDFSYSEGVLNKLKTGYKNYWAGTDWTVPDVNAYLSDVYASGGIIESIYDALASVYTNFTDPYIYDFDFITSSGFVYEQYKLDDQYVTEAVTAGTAVANIPIPAGTTATINTKYSGVETKMVADADGKFYNGETFVATLNYTTGVITVESGQTLGTNPELTYANCNAPKVASVVYPVTSNTDGYYAQYSSVTPIHQSMLELVNTRQDCIALFDVPHDYDKSAIVEYSRMLNTSYGTIHNPWCWVNSPDIAGKQILMAPSYIFLYTLVSNLIDNVESQKWFPPAGVSRATARVVVRPEYEIGSVILNAWQNDNTSRVNPIMKLKQYGYVIYGQYTTLEAIDLYTHSALESLNVRLIANVVKKKIFDACMNLAFEPNTQTLWLKFYAQMDEYLRFMKYNQGLYDYRIVMDESTVTTDDINHLRCPGKVYIAPTRTAEFFDIDFIITGAGAIFTD